MTSEYVTFDLTTVLLIHNDALKNTNSSSNSTAVSTTPMANGSQNFFQMDKRLWLLTVLIWIT